MLKNCYAKVQGGVSVYTYNDTRTNITATWN